MSFKRILTITISILLTTTGFSQFRFIVFFSDKGDISNVKYEGLISSKSAKKRALHQIGFDHYDLPVNSDYIEYLQQESIHVISTSKWLNAAIVETTLNQKELESIGLPISKIQEINTTKGPHHYKFKKEQNTEPTTPPKNVHFKNASSIDYGLAQTQNEYFEIEHLHDKGFLGSNVSVAFFDVGYSNMDNIPELSQTFTNNKVIDTYDFWDDSTYVYHKDTHGRGVSFVVLGNEPGTFVGMAPNVDVMLYITDDISTETYQDEFYYVKALERVDSIGVDIVNASINYKVFDGTGYDYLYSDMDGNTAISTLGCNVAAQKGILIVNAAGNSGYLGAPSDAFGILAVGGADRFYGPDYISSHGPTADGRIRPNIAGLTEYAQTIYNSTISGSIYMGTSTATPFITGLAACLMEAHPTHSISQIISAIEQSGSRANNPDSLLGYGIPNARIADSLLSSVTSINDGLGLLETISIYPNPSTGLVSLKNATGITQVTVVSITGQVISSSAINNKTKVQLEISENGFYKIQVTDANQNIINTSIIIAN